MALNLEAGIAAFQSQVGKSTYSMEHSRNYSDGTCDCSGAVYYALRASGGFDYGYTPSTETLHDYLTKLGFVKIAENTDFEMKRGQVIIWGQRGFSAGAFGHTGIALDGQNWIECTAWSGAGPYGGTIVSNHDQRWAMAGGPYFYAYELKSATNTVPESNVQKPTVPQIKEDEIMYVYWKQNKENRNQFDAFFVNGNTRMHIPNDTLLKECQDLVKRYKGVTEETKYSYDNWGVAAIEKTTNLVKW